VFAAVMFAMACFSAGFGLAAAGEPAAGLKSVDDVKVAAKWAKAVEKEFKQKFNAGQLGSVPMVKEAELFGLPVSVQKKYKSESDQTDNGVIIYKLNVQDKYAFLVANDGDESTEVWAFDEAGLPAGHFKCSSDKTEKAGMGGGAIPAQEGLGAAETKGCVGEGGKCSGSYRCCKGMCSDGFCHGGGCIGEGGVCTSSYRCCGRAICSEGHCKTPGGGVCIGEGGACTSSYLCCGRAMCSEGHCKAY